MAKESNVIYVVCVMLFAVDWVNLNVDSLEQHLMSHFRLRVGAFCCKRQLCCKQVCLALCLWIKSVLLPRFSCACFTFVQVQHLQEFTPTVIKLLLSLKTERVKCYNTRSWPLVQSSQRYENSHVI